LLLGGVDSSVRAFEPHPFFIERGEGSRIRDVDGNEYKKVLNCGCALITNHYQINYYQAHTSDTKKSVLPKRILYEFFLLHPKTFHPHRD